MYPSNIGIGKYSATVCTRPAIIFCWLRWPRGQSWRVADVPNNVYADRIHFSANNRDNNRRGREWTKISEVNRTFFKIAKKKYYLTFVSFNNKYLFKILGGEAVKPQKPPTDLVRPTTYHGIQKYDKTERSKRFRQGKKIVYIINWSNGVFRLIIGTTQKRSQGENRGSFLLLGSIII